MRTQDRRNKHLVVRSMVLEWGLKRKTGNIGKEKEGQERDRRRERERENGRFWGNEISPEGGFKIRAQLLHNVLILGQWFAPLALLRASALPANFGDHGTDIGQSTTGDCSICPLGDAYGNMDKNKILEWIKNIFCNTTLNLTNVHARKCERVNIYTHFVWLDLRTNYTRSLKARGISRKCVLVDEFNGRSLLLFIIYIFCVSSALI